MMHWNSTPLAPTCFSCRSRQHDLCRSLACVCCNALFTTREINGLAFIAWLVQSGRLDGDTQAAQEG